MKNILNYGLVLLLGSFSSTCRADTSYLRIDHKMKFEAMNESTYPVVDISGYHEIFPSGLIFKNLANLFKSNTAIFGFGSPISYIGLISSEEDQKKFSSKIFLLTPSRMGQSDEIAEPGILVVPNPLPSAALGALERAAMEEESRNTLSGSRAIAVVLKSAGFELGGNRNLSLSANPSSLLKAIIQFGLQFKGQTLNFDIVSTTPHSLNEYISEMEEHEKLSTDHFFHQNSQKDVFEATRKDQKEAQGNEKSHQHEDQFLVDIQVGEASSIGRFFRRLWGPHPLYRIKLNEQMRLEESLPITLKPFEHPKGSIGTWLKRNLLKRFFINELHKNMARTYKDFPKMSVSEFMQALKKEQVYNIVVDDSGISISLLELGWVSWVLSKHILLSNDSPNVRFAGEMIKKSDSKILLTRNSGTYMPTSAQLEQFREVLQKLLPSVQIDTEEKIND